MSWFYKFEVTDKELVEMNQEDNITAQHLLSKLQILSESYHERLSVIDHTRVVYGYGSDQIVPLVSQLKSLFKKESYAS